MGRVKMPGAGGMNITNGKIAEYISQNAEIPPNTFVQSASWTSQILGSVQTHATDIKLCEFTPISDGKFLFSYSRGAYLYHCVATVSGTSVSLGTSVSSNITQCEGYLDVQQLASGKYLVSYRRYRGSDSGYAMTAYVLTVSGNTVTIGTSTDIISTSDYLIYGCMAVRSSTTAVVFAKTSLGDSSQICFLTISGTSISVNSTTPSLSTTGYAYLGAIAIDSSKILAIRIKDSTSSVQSVYADVLSISGTTVTITSSSSSGSAYGNIFNTLHVRLIKLSGTRYLASWVYDNKTNIIAPIKVSGTTPTLGTGYYDAMDRNISDRLNYQVPSIAALSASKVVQIRGDNTLEYAVYSVSDSNVTVVESPTTLYNNTMYTGGGCAVSGEKCVAFGDISYDRTQCFSVVFSPKTSHFGVAPSTGTITGVTQTKVTPEKAGKVWIYSA